MRHNPEKRAWRGRSYKKGGQRPRVLREQLAIVDRTMDEIIQEEKEAMKIRYWCMGCGAYDPYPCNELGHISLKKITSKGHTTDGPTTIAAKYEGKLVHLAVKLPK